MNAHDHTRKLPIELLSLIFGELSLDEIMESSRVSRLWRHVARRHPVYWRDINLASLSTTALDFFLDRLDAGSCRTISVFICLPEVAFPVRLRSIVLPAIERNMVRICSLSAKFPLHCDNDVFGILRTPAPRLTKLNVYVADDATVSTAFPVDLFANQAPGLAHLHLFNVRIAAPDFPQVISRLESLYYCSPNEETFPAALLSQCTSLRKLSIFGKYFFVTPSTTHAYTSARRNLDELIIAVARDSLHILQSFKCASIARIITSLKDQPAGKLLLGHLSGALHLRLEYTRQLFFLEYTSAAGPRRAFVWPRLDTAMLTIPDIYTTDDLLSRIRSVEISADCIPFLSTLGALPACSRIVVLAAVGHPLTPPAAQAVLPKLETLELRCDSAYSEADARAFFDAMVAQSKNPVRVCLTGGHDGREIRIAPRQKQCTC